MSLTRLTNKKVLTILGLNSGTSADGLDMAAVRVSWRGKSVRCTYLVGQTAPYPAALRSLVLEMADAAAIDPNDLIYLDNLLGKFYGQRAGRFIEKLSREGIKIDATASHGQTVRHLPTKIKRAATALGGTLQIGSADFIAHATGKVVVSDFRQADVAAGGEGAPITGGAMYRLFADQKQSRLIVNIGGMSNYFYFPAAKLHRPGRVADCGPGNSLVDILSRELFKERFDRNGRRAHRGAVSEKMLAKLMSQPFFAGATISTGREAFGRNLAARMMKQANRMHLSRQDLIATASELTVQAIAGKVRPLLRRDKSLSKLYLTGGGKHNMFFTTRLRQVLPELSVRLIDELGIDGDFVEAAAFAVMGEACLRGTPLTMSAKGTRGGRLQPVPGKITQPPKR